MVPDHRPRREARAPTREPQPEPEVLVLLVHEERLVESAHLAERRGAQEHPGAGGEGDLARLVRHVGAVGEVDPRAAAVQSLLLLHPDRDRVNTAGNRIHFLGFGSCGGYRAPRASVPDEPREIAFASGAAVLLRGAALREVGAFDASLFLYQEDQDLGIRLRLAGWRARLAPRSVVWHHYAFSRNPRKYFLLERNRYIVLAKNLKPRSLLVLAPFVLLADLALLPVAIAGGWLPEKLRAWRALLSREVREHVRAERARVARLRRISDRELGRWISPALEFEGLPGSWLPRLARGPMALVWRLLRPLLG